MKLALKAVAASLSLVIDPFAISLVVIVFATRRSPVSVSALTFTLTTAPSFILAVVILASAILAVVILASAIFAVVTFKSKILLEVTELL